MFVKFQGKALRNDFFCLAVPNSSLNFTHISLRKLKNQIKKNYQVISSSQEAGQAPLKIDGEAIPKETPSPSPVPAWEQPPDAPVMNYNWVDITEKFKEACDNLKLGELVHEPNFGLFEAMSAIEMMDPKMDAGMAGKQTKRQVLSLKECVEQNRIKLKDLKPSELIIIMDTCQSCIFSWLDGQSLAQTVFTCLYLHDVDVIEDRCLKAYCLGVLKVCDIIKERIFKANVFEEEDFQTLTYGFKFGSNVTELRVVGMLREVEDDVNRTIKAVMKNSKLIDQSDNHKSESEKKKMMKATIEFQAVLARVKFLRLLLQVLLAFGKKELEFLHGCRKHLKQMTEQLKLMDETANLGLEPTISDDGHELVIGFEPLVNQRLLPPTFPRYSKLRKRSELTKCFTELIKRLFSIVEMTALQSFYAVLKFIIEFAHSEPCVMTRSLLQIAFLPDNIRVFGHQSVTDVLKDSLRAFNFPPILSPHFTSLQSNPRAKEHLDIFLQRASRTMCKLIQVYGHNYARQREKLAALLDDLALLQDEADRCDTDLHSIMQSQNHKTTNNFSHLTSIGSWVLYHTLRVMIQYVTSGFCLELYSPHEFHYVYWYLAEVLYSWQITTLNRAESQLLREEQLSEKNNTKSRNNKKTKKNKKKNRLHSQELAQCQAAQMMAAGCFKAVLGFFMDGKVKAPDFVFDSEAIRFEHRFSPFISVSTPPFTPYKQFQEMTDLSQYQPPPTAQDLYGSSSKHFAQAKVCYENMTSSDENAKLLLVAKTNFVVTKLLAGGHKKDSAEEPTFDFSVNNIFPIFRVT